MGKFWDFSVMYECFLLLFSSPLWLLLSRTSVLSTCIYALQYTHQYMKSPLNYVDSASLIRMKIEKACTLEAFREKHALDVNVHNVFVESSNFGQSFIEGTQILDTILEDQVSALKISKPSYFNGMPLLTLYCEVCKLVERLKLEFLATLVRNCWSICVNRSTACLCRH